MTKLLEPRLRVFSAPKDLQLITPEEIGKLSGGWNHYVFNGKNDQVTIIGVAGEKGVTIYLFTPLDVEPVSSHTYVTKQVSAEVIEKVRSAYHG